jgi:hypothetical protein
MPDTVNLDACCTLCLCATGRIDDILHDLTYSFVTGRRARGESLYLEVPGLEERELVDLDSLFQQRLLREEELTEPAEVASFVRLAARLNDGEAEAGALAAHRGYILATDDRKARRIIVEEHPSVRLLSTPELLHGWQSAAAPTNTEMAAVLRNVRQRATFQPRRSDPLYGWWVTTADG